MQNSRFQRIVRSKGYEEAVIEKQIEEHRAAYHWWLAQKEKRAARLEAWLRDATSPQLPPSDQS